MLDFGIAKIVQPDLKVDSLETQAGTVFGTPRYMSPEQAQSKPLDGRSDLYTVGLILFQMVTGRHCFPDEDAVVVMARHIQSLPPRPREVAPDAGISRKLEALILRSLAKDPRRRPQTALELHEELVAAANDRPEPMESAVVPVAHGTSINPVSDPSLEIAAPPISPQRQNARVIVIGAAFVVVLIGAVGLGAGLAQRRSPPPVVAEKPAAAKPVAPQPEPAKTAELLEPDPVPSATAAAAASAPKPKTTAKPSVSAKVDTPPPVETAKVEPPPPPPPPTTSATVKKKPGSYGKFD